MSGWQIGGIIITALIALFTIGVILCGIRDSNSTYTEAMVGMLKFCVFLAIFCAVPWVWANLWDTFDDGCNAVPFALLIAYAVGFGHGKSQKVGKN